MATGLACATASSARNPRDDGRPEAGVEESTLNTLTLSEREGRTTLTILVQAASKQTRDAIIESGMEAGLQDALDLLEQAAVSLA